MKFLKKSNSHFWGTTEIILAFSLAGSSIVVAKLLSTRVPVFLTGVLSLVVAFIVLLPFQSSKMVELKRIDKREFLLMVLQGLCGIVLFRVFTLVGLQYTSASNASIITSATPAVMAIAAFLVLRENPKSNVLLGIAAAVSGLVIINIQSIDYNQQSATLWGNLLIGLAVVSEVLMTIFRRATKANISSITNTTVLILISIILMLPMALFELRDFDLILMSKKDWIAIVYYGAIATSAAYILWGDGALKIPASYTGVAMASMPISALLLSHLILDESLTNAHLVGCALAILGIVISNVKVLGERIRLSKLDPREIFLSKKIS